MPSLLFVLILSCMISGIVAVSLSDAPWQSNSGRNVLDEELYGDQPPTVFAPGGRLYSVERTVAAASSLDDPSSNLVVALSCREGLVIVTTSPTSPHLDVLVDDDEEMTTSMLSITTEGHRAPLSHLCSNIWMATGGNAVDSTILRYKIGHWAQDMLEANDGGQPLPSTSLSCAALAKRASNYLQEPTQTIGKAGRILASYALLAGRDERNVHSLWRVDPTGQFWKCDATVIGRGAGAAEAHLTNLVSAGGHENDVSKFFASLSSKQAISTACECIEKALPKENKFYWQALVLRASCEDQQASYQVLTGDEIQTLLAKLMSMTDEEADSPVDDNT